MKDNCVLVAGPGIVPPSTLIVSCQAQHYFHLYTAEILQMNSQLGNHMCGLQSQAEVFHSKDWCMHAQVVIRLVHLHAQAEIRLVCLLVYILHGYCTMFIHIFTE